MKRNVHAIRAAGVCLLALASSTWAQIAAAKEAGAKSVKTVSIVRLQEVTVTGSRVITNNSNSPTPIMGVSTAQLMDSVPGPIADSVNLLPVFSGSRGLTSNPGINATGVQGSNGAADVLNLRNLGPYRTLVLLDGQRIPPTLSNGVVDVDMIPQELLKRVEVVTGGVSAVYGSDAVSGVVNFITNNQFNGVKLHAQYGISQHGDDKQPDFGVATGTSLFGGRGHVEASYEYRDDQGLNYRSARPANDLVGIEGAGTASNPYHLVSGVHLAGYPFGGLVTSGPLSGENFAGNGILSAFQKGSPTGSACCQVGGAGGYFDASLKAALKSQQLFGRLDYDFNHNLQGHVVAAANLKTNTVYTTYAQLSNVTLSAANAFLPATYSNLLTAAGNSTFTFSKLMNDAPRNQGVVNSDQYYFNAGLNGKLGRYRWQTSYNYGMTRLDAVTMNDLNQQHLAASLNAAIDPTTGQPVCAASLSDPSAYSNCVPLNVFGPTAASAAAINYIMGNVESASYTRMNDLNGQISGAPFDDWAGPVSVALSAEWRRMSYSANSNGTPAQFANCTDLTYNCKSGSTLLWNTTFPASGTVSQSVGEEAMEFNAPILKNSPFVRALDLNGAARYTNYNTSGDYVTWKIGVNWRVTDRFRIRGTESRDIRAPTLFDLYQPLTTVRGSFPDLLTGHSPYVPSNSNGNPQLKAEIGKTTTAGFVWRPEWLPGSDLSVDGYDITIDNAITVVSGFDPAYQRACYASGGSSPYCALQVRPDGFSNSSAANVITAWLAEPQNIAQLETYGADLDFDYIHAVLQRPFSMRLLANYQPHILYRQPNTPTIDMGDAAWGPNGLTASPSLQLTAFLAYEATRDLVVNLTEQWRNAMKESGVPGQIWIDNHVPSFGTTSVTLSYDLQRALHVGDSNVFLTVENLFNSTPPPTAFYGNGTNVGYFYGFSDNPVGRYFTVGVRLRY